MIDDEQIVIGVIFVFFLIFVGFLSHAAGANNFEQRYYELRTHCDGVLEVREVSPEDSLEQTLEIICAPKELTQNEN